MASTAMNIASSRSHTVCLGLFMAVRSPAGQGSFCFIHRFEVWALIWYMVYSGYTRIPDYGPMIL